MAVANSGALFRCSRAPSGRAAPTVPCSLAALAPRVPPSPNLVLGAMLAHARPALCWRSDAATRQCGLRVSVRVAACARGGEGPGTSRDHCSEKTLFQRSGAEDGFRPTREVGFARMG